MKQIIVTEKKPFACLNKDFPEIYNCCQYSVLNINSHRLACIWGRISVEKMIEKIFKQARIPLPTKNITSLIKTELIKKKVPSEVITKIKAISKSGNKAAHEIQEPHAEEVVNMLRNLLDIAYWLCNTKGEIPALVFKLKSIQKIEKINIDNLINDWLKLQKSDHTKRAYQSAITDFCNLVYPELNVKKAIQYFLQINENNAKEKLSNYRQRLLESRLSNSSINLKLSGINSFILHAYANGKSSHQAKIKLAYNRKIKNHISVNQEEIKRIISQIDSSQPKGARDQAIIELLYVEKLSRGKVAALNIDNIKENKLVIIEKQRKQEITLSKSSQIALSNWLKLRNSMKIDNSEKALFLNLSYYHRMRRLSDRGILNIVKSIGEGLDLGFTFNPRNLKNIVF